MTWRENVASFVNALPVSKWLNVTKCHLHWQPGLIWALLSWCWFNWDRLGLPLLPKDKAVALRTFAALGCPAVGAARNKPTPIHKILSHMNDFISMPGLSVWYLGLCLSVGWNYIFFYVKHREVPITYLYLHRSWSDKAHKSHIDQQDLSVCYPSCWAAARIF